MTLADLLEQGADDHAALISPAGPTLTYADVRRHVAAIASAIAERGIAPGDRVAASLVNGPALVLGFFGIANARAMAAPLNPAYTVEEFAFYLEDIAPKLLVCAPGDESPSRVAAARLGIPIVELSLDDTGAPAFDGTALTGTQAPAPEDDDAALFLHTSGTTSRPKGVPLTHHNLTTSADNMRRWYKLDADDVSLCVMPLFHIHGIVFSTLSIMLAGATVVVPERFSASAFWPLIAQYGVTIVSAVPTILRTLLLRADDDNAPLPGAHPVRFLRSSSAPMPTDTLRGLEARFGVPLIEAYSMTEASHQMCANPLEGERIPGSVGIGAFVEVAIMNEDGALLPVGEVGEVVIRGENVTRGYYNNPAANAAAFTNGWFRTGDFGKLDERNYLTLVGRIKELINRAGEKISPVEVDEALLAMPNVIEAVSFAYPDTKYGEVVACALVLEAGGSPAAVLAGARTRLAPFKVPSVVFVADSIPRTATGKVQRRAVAAAFADATPVAV